MAHRVKLTAQNFEIIKDAKIIVEGITAITGETDNGKTALFNSAKVLAYNIPGTDYIRKIKSKPSKQGCSVGLFFEDTGTFVKYAKKTSPSYTVGKNGQQQLFEKAGRGEPPQQVADLLNMDYLNVEGKKIGLNFINQLQPPLLYGLSMHQLYKLVVKSFDGEKIQEAISLCKEDIDQSSKDLQAKEIEIEVQKKQRLFLLGTLKSYEPIMVHKEAFTQYDENCRKLPILRQYREEQESNHANIQECQKVLKTLGKLPKLEELHQKILKNKNLILKLGEIKTNKEQLHKTILRHQKVYKSLLQVKKPLFNEEFQAYQSRKERSKLLQDLNNQKLEVSLEIDRSTKKLKSLKGLKAVMKSYKSYKETNTRLHLLIELQKAKEANDELLSIYGEQYNEATLSINELERMVKEKICPTCNQKMKQNNMEATDTLTERIEALKTKQTEASSKLELYNQSDAKINKKIKEAGCDPKDLAGEIKKLEEENTKFEKKIIPELEKMEESAKELEDEEHVADPEQPSFDDPDFNSF